jgi:hypothetical protein
LIRSGAERGSRTAGSGSLEDSDDDPDIFEYCRSTTLGSVSLGIMEASRASIPSDFEVSDNDLDVSNTSRAAAKASSAAGRRYLFAHVVHTNAPSSITIDLSAMV